MLITCNTPLSWQRLVVIGIEKPPERGIYEDVRADVVSRLASPEIPYRRAIPLRRPRLGHGVSINSPSAFDCSSLAHCDDIMI
jgi:hypothetical protein